MYLKIIFLSHLKANGDKIEMKNIVNIVFIATYS